MSPSPGRSRCRRRTPRPRSRREAAGRVTPGKECARVIQMAATPRIGLVADRACPYRVKVSRTSPPTDSQPDHGQPGARRTDFAGAVYGSLLAASVVATAGSLGTDYPRFQLVLLLIITGVVFWMAHVYARVAGQRVVGKPWSRGEIRRAAAREWSIVEAAVLPAAAVGISPVLGLDLAGAAWLALGTAVAQQVTWACLGAKRAGATSGQVVVEGVVNLLLGLAIVAAKASLGH